MPPLSAAAKSKNKTRESRRSRSRNTTPSSVISAGTAPAVPTVTAYLELDTSKLYIPNHPQYSDALEKLESRHGALDPKQLQEIIDQLKQLSDSADKRAESCENAIRRLHETLREVEADQKERDRQAEQARRAKAKKEAQNETTTKNGKAKKRKDRVEVFDNVEVKHEGQYLSCMSYLFPHSGNPSAYLPYPFLYSPCALTTGARSRLAGRMDINAIGDMVLLMQTIGCPALDWSLFSTLQIPNYRHSIPTYMIESEETAKPKIHRILDDGPVDSPSPSKKAKFSPGTSSLSEVADSPDGVPDLTDHTSPAKTDVSMDDTEDNRVIHRPPPVPLEGFFPDPLAPDPVIYHIRDITPDMTDEEKKEIYGVTAFPTKDLSEQIAGTPPDKDFSNAKPTNQVAATTFLAYVEPYLRQLQEEDIAWLKERGDRVTPFLAVPRDNINYQERWAREDGNSFSDSRPDSLPVNQGRGSVDQIGDDNAHTDQIGPGPLAARLLALLKFEHRSLPSETNNSNDFSFMNGDVNDTMDLDGLTNGHDSSEKPLPPAASVADLTGSKSTQQQRLEYAQADERLKMELRHLNLLGHDENPDYDAHYDDDISERLRLLQAELRRVMIVNGARKARLYDLAKERMAHQEYSTIHEDLDSQVQQAYLKRTRTLGKTKKGGPGVGKPKAGAAGLVNGFAGAGVGALKRDIGENARMLMDRRRRWEDCIGPVFKDMKHGIPGREESLWDGRIMEQYERLEVEALEEEQGE